MYGTGNLPLGGKQGTEPHHSFPYEQWRMLSTNRIFSNKFNTTASIYFRFENYCKSNVVTNLIQETSVTVNFLL